MNKLKALAGCLVVLTLAGCTFLIYPGIRLDRVAVQCDYSRDSGVEQCKILVLADDKHKGESWAVDWEEFPKYLQRYIEVGACHSTKHYVVTAVEFNPETQRIIQLTPSHCEKRVRM